MTVRMTNQQWQDLPEEDKEILKTLELLNLVKPKMIKTPVQSLPLPKPYILLKIFKCILCETTFINYFRMLPLRENPYILQAKAIAFKNILPTDTVRKEKETCSGCFHCYEVLAKKTKRELIKRIITLAGRR